jgi:hypothetical protein
VRRAKQLKPEGAHPLLLAAVGRGAGGRVDMQVCDAWLLVCWGLRKGDGWLFVSLSLGDQRSAMACG